LRLGRLPPGLVARGGVERAGVVAEGEGRDARAQRPGDVLPRRGGFAEEAAEEAARERERPEQVREQGSRTVGHGGRARLRPTPRWGRWASPPSRGHLQ